jgi:hypothetical protein
MVVAKVKDQGYDQQTLLDHPQRALMFEIREEKGTLYGWSEQRPLPIYGRGQRYYAVISAIS